MTDTAMSYPPPVDKLLTYGDCRTFREWPDYLALGLGPEHVPDLIRMATDPELNWADSDSLEVWAPIHAWRALGQLRAEAAIEPLLRLFEELEDGDWVAELSKVYGMIGPAAIPALTTYLADKSHGLYPRAYAADGLGEIGQRHPEARARCVAALTQQLERFKENDPALNGFVLADLIDLRAIESAPEIERAFAAGQVDESIMGDWEDVQIELGLKAHRGRPRKPSTDPLFGPDIRKLFDEAIRSRSRPTSKEEFAARAERAVLEAQLRAAAGSKRKRHRRTKKP